MPHKVAPDTDLLNGCSHICECHSRYTTPVPVIIAIGLLRGRYSPIIWPLNPVDPLANDRELSLD